MTEFHFRQKSLKVDWNKIGSADLDKLLLQPDFDVLQSFVSNLVYCNIDAEPISKSTNPHFVKLVKLSQMVIEYLLFSQDRLVQTLSEMEKAKSNAEQQRDSLKSHYRRRLHQLEQNQKTKENYRDCPFCNKTFAGDEFFKSHLERRHLAGPMETKSKAKMNAADRPDDGAVDVGPLASSAVSNKPIDHHLVVERNKLQMELSQMTNERNRLQIELNKAQLRIEELLDKEHSLENQHRRHVEQQQVLFMKELSKIHSLSVSMAFAAKVTTDGSIQRKFTSNFGQLEDDQPNELDPKTASTVAEELVKMRQQFNDFLTQWTLINDSKPIVDEMDLEQLLALVEEQSEKLMAQQNLLVKLIASGQVNPSLVGSPTVVDGWQLSPAPVDRTNVADGRSDLVVDVVDAGGLVPPPRVKRQQRKLDKLEHQVKTDVRVDHEKMVVEDAESEGSEVEYVSSLVDSAGQTPEPVKVTQLDGGE